MLAHYTVSICIDILFFNVFLSSVVSVDKKLKVVGLIKTCLSKYHMTINSKIKNFSPVTYFRHRYRSKIKKSNILVVEFTSQTGICFLNIITNISVDI